MLVAREAQVTAEHEELLSMNHDLMRKLQAERAEITRLRDEIQEMQTLYGYRYNTEETMNARAIWLQSFGNGPSFLFFPFASILSFPPSKE